MIVTLPDGSAVHLHHTFNALHNDTWIWTIDDLKPYLVGQTITFNATASDVGSDDLTFTWSFGDGSPDASTIYYNNGFSPDSYLSPEVNPISVTDVATHSYPIPGTFKFMLTVIDDDGGLALYTFNIAIG